LNFNIKVVGTTHIRIKMGYFYLKREGYTVVMVSTSTTHLSRPMAHHDFSRTDPKDAQLVASNALSGNFDLYQEYSASANGMHLLGITAVISRCFL
jgi:hypothetical protein